MVLKYNKKSFLDFLLLLMTIGFPRFPLIGIPMVSLVFFIKYKEIIHFHLKFNSKIYFFYILLFIFFFFSLLLSFSYVDFIFCLLLTIKIIISFFSGIIIANILIRSPKVLKYWIFFQVMFIALTLFSIDFYKLALLFVAPTATETFDDLFGIKALGFGLYHVEGAITLTFMVLFYINTILRDKSIIKTIIYFLASLSSIFLARTSMIAISIFFFLKRPIFFIFMIIMLFLLILNIEVNNKTFLYVLELFYSIVENGKIHTYSTQHNSEMIVLPNYFIDYFYGIGKFYNNEEGASSGYYMYTDLGWIRLLLFGGLLFCLIFLIINIYWVLLSLRKGRIFFKIFFISVYILITLKGLYSLVFISVLIFYYESHLQIAINNPQFKLNQI